MTDSKLTDKDENLIEALKREKYVRIAYKGKVYSFKDVIDLINCYEAENERLNEKIKSVYKELERIALKTVETDKQGIAGD